MIHTTQESPVYYYCFIIKDTNKQVKKCIGQQGLGGSWAQELMSPWGRVYHPPGTSICSVTQLSKSYCAELLLRFHYIGMINSIIGHVIECNLQPLSRSQGWGVGLKVGCFFWPASNPEAISGLWELTISHPISFNSDMVQWGSLWLTKDTPPSLRKSLIF